MVLTRAGRIRLVNFGNWNCTERRMLSQSTPFYLAPEQWNNSSATEPGDLYAVTVTFFECVVGAPPFHAESPEVLAKLHQRGIPPLDVLPGSVRELVRVGLAKDPADRPCAEGLLVDVERAAVQSLGRGWERRGRDELARLLEPSVSWAENPELRRCRKESRLLLGKLFGAALLLAIWLHGPLFDAPPLPLVPVIQPGPVTQSPHYRLPVVTSPLD
jgi:serine/threonine protein kinase